MATILILLFLQCFLFHKTISSPNITTDQSTLLQFKSKIIDPNNFLKTWVATKNVCNWTGIQCGKLHQRVITLNISNMGLIGNIPPGLGNLSFLTSLDLGVNNFNGNPPEDFVHLGRLRFLNLYSNNFTGSLPKWLFTMSNLQFVYLHFNRFTGIIPPVISNLTELQIFNIRNNSLFGKIPQEIGKIKKLVQVILEDNKLSGPIPSTLFNISTLEAIALTENQLSGNLPADLCRYLPKLKGLYLGGNHFSGGIPLNLHECSLLQILGLEFNNFNGYIPRGISNLTMLNTLALQDNNFSGELPKEIGRLQLLEKLYLDKNSFSGVIPESLSNCSHLKKINLAANLFIAPLSKKGLPEELSIITSLSNCRNLEVLALYENPLKGTLPKSLGNYSLALKAISIANCYISGIIPVEIGNLSNLWSLFFDSNIITGPIPTTIKSLQQLQALGLLDNQIIGQIPVSICEMPSLAFLRLETNRITGKIPECLGTMMSLREFNFSSNLLESNIPFSIWNLTDLLKMSISLNKLTGTLPHDIGKMEALALMDLSGNRFSGNLPPSFGSLKNLEKLILGNNSFEGAIPESFDKLISLQFLDLSNNNFSGGIPKSLVSLSNLEYFNVSFNKFIGEIPNEGPFLKFNSSFFAWNEALCGNSRYNVPPCISNSSENSKRRKIFWWIFLIIGGSFVIVVLAMGVVLKKYKRPVSTLFTEDILQTTRRISYYELVQATEGFNASNLLGEGGFGSVYKGILNDGTTIAVKVFKPEVQGAFRSFEAECEALRNIRHRNLVKVISSCSNTDFKALVLEYMPNGSLDKWLHSDDYYLDMLQRLNMMIDVADALEYLHHGFSTPIVHCDLKPSNILFDENMTAHVSDFGLTKFMNEDSTTHTNTLATYGYIAPEYGSEGLVSRAADVYSFGILLMEIFTGKKPSDEIFNENLNVRDWVHKYFLKGQVDQVIDSKLLNLHEGDINQLMQCVSKIMELALNCCVKSPKDRMNMKDVDVILQKIKIQFQTSR